jgi:hypothetical protein
MEVILSDRVKSFTGSLGAGFGYSIRRRGNGFFAMRSPKGFVPVDGHWRFIKACADLALQELHIVDILVTAKELRAALDEAGKIFYPSRLVKARKGEIWHASQVIDLVNNCGL